jgi:hypothetical protein
MKSFNYTIGFCILICFLISNDIFSQPWKRNRKEIYGGFGATNFLGELGGRDQIGRTFLYDLEFVMTRPALTVGYRYTHTPYTKFRAALSWGMLKGNDMLTLEPFRNNRNLHFRSPVVELSGAYEIYFNQESAGQRYNIKGARGMRSKNLTYYSFVGLGVFYFNPKALYNGKWVALQPLGTEGQGLPGERKKYSRINASIPVGFGMRYQYNKQIRVGVELAYRKTFTDYLDDVSTEYYDNAILRAERGDVAAALADPNLGNFPGQLNEHGKTRHGLQRGDPTEKDAFLFALITVNYTIQKRSSRAKF